MEQKKTPWYDKIEKAMLIVEMIACLGILFVNVVTRFCFSYTASWSEQAARLLFVWMSFTAASLCGMYGSHLQVTAVTLFKNEKFADVMFWIGDIITVVFSAYIAMKLMVVFKTVYNSNQIFPAIPWLPAYWLYMPGVLGMAGLALRTMQKRFRQIRDAKSGKNHSANKEEEA